VLISEAFLNGNFMGTFATVLDSFGAFLFGLNFIFVMGFKILIANKFVD